MPKKNNAIARAEIVSDADSSILEPFFQSKRRSYEIRRQQDVVQQRKFRAYFDDWSCMVCGKEDAGYGSHGMCKTCYGRVDQRMRVTLGRVYAARPTFDKPRDLIAVAQEALAPSIKALRPSLSGGNRKVPALPAGLDGTLTTAEVAKEVGFSKTTLQRLLSAGKIKAPKLMRVHGVTYRLWTAKQVESLKKIPSIEFRLRRAARHANRAQR